MNTSDDLEWPSVDHARPRLDRMNVLLALWLALTVVIAGPTQAQRCAGGSGGGADATGNECNDSATLALYAGRYDAAAPLPATRTGTIGSPRAANGGAASAARSSGASNAPKPAVRGPQQVANATRSLVTMGHFSSPESASSMPCSGGSYGGMDMTGNQCGDYPEADRNMHPVFASRQ